VDADIEQLEEATKSIKDFADKYVAHNELAPTVKVPQFSELSRALKGIESLHNKYAGLLTGFSTAMVPAIQYPWENIFRQPWIKSV
jgi:hypothetical protein